MIDPASDAHRALVERTLRLEAGQWAQVAQAFEAERDSAPTVEQRLALLGRVFQSVVGHHALRPMRGRCPCCGGGVHPLTDDGALEMGQCGGCGHGSILQGAAPPEIYGPAYYQSKASGGAGYDAYLSERAYREGKGRRLLDRLRARHGGEPSTLLEVGSGFGFTRAAGEALGLRTLGVDVNPEAAKVCERLYGLPTVTGTTRDVSGQFDLVLYQFVLEHVADVGAEVAAAKRLCAPGGLVCFVVPSVDAAERLVFAARYRSFRSDHLHVFSRRSIATVLTNAEFRDVHLESECNLHLLAGFLSKVELDSLYARGEGPDLVVTARS